MVELVPVRLEPLGEGEYECVRRAVGYSVAHAWEMANLGSLMTDFRGFLADAWRGSAADEMFTYARLVDSFTPKYVADEGAGVPLEVFVGLVPGWSAWVSLHQNDLRHALLSVAEWVLGEKFEGWATEDCKHLLLCSCAGEGFMCSSRSRVNRFLERAVEVSAWEDGIPVVGSSPAVNVLSAIQEGICQREVPIREGHEGRHPYEIWDCMGDVYTDEIIRWACRLSGVWVAGDYALTRHVLSTPVEEPTDEELTEPLEQGDWVTIEVGSGCQPEANADEEPVKRWSWFRRLFGV